MFKKILVLTNSSSGLFDFRKELLLELSQIADIVVTVPENDKRAELETIGCRVVNIPMERRGMNPLRDLKLLFAYIKIIKAEKPELVITYTIKPNVYGGFANKLLKIPYAVNITGLGTAFQNEGILRKLVIWMYKVSLEKAKVVYFENIENLQVIVSKGIIEKNQACLLNGAGVNLQYFEPAEYPIKDEPIRFLFVGRVMKEKGIDELFEAMERLYKEGMDVELDVLGNYEEHYEEKINEFEQVGWLKYYGYQKDVRPFIEQSHCFVLPSWHEGMANTNLECAAMARPLITSRIHGCMEAVVEGKSGFLCERKDAESLYEVMKKFIALDYEERRSMGLEGRKHMEEVFDKKKVVEATIEKLVD